MRHRGTKQGRPRRPRGYRWFCDQCGAVERVKLAEDASASAGIRYDDVPDWATGLPSKLPIARKPVDLARVDAQARNVYLSYMERPPRGMRGALGPGDVAVVSETASVSPDLVGKYAVVLAKPTPTMRIKVALDGGQVELVDSHALEPVDGQGLPQRVLETAAAVRLGSSEDELASLSKEE